jgi:polysaccharide export outer membrane protein
MGCFLKRTDTFVVSMLNIRKILFFGFSLLFFTFNTSFAAQNGAAAGTPAYLIGPGDVLNVSVWKEDGLQKEVLVRPDGGLSFPLVGDLVAGGKSVAQLQAALADKLKKFIPDPVVTVSVLKINDNKIYVVGKVARPGEFIPTQYVDVMQALAMAGGLTTYAKSNDIIILRREKGREVAIPFEYDDVAGGENLGQNIILKSGDVVVVP